MTFKKSRLLGLLAAVSSYPFVLASIILSPWFNFYDFALSDLGNMTANVPIAYIFNAGIMLSGVFVTAFAVLLSSSNRAWKYLIWTVPLTIAGISLTLIGIFPVNAGMIHSLVSVAFFVLIILTMLIYGFSSWRLASPRLGVIALAMGLASTLIWSATWPWDGVAIQETITSAMSASWLIMVSRYNI